MKPTARCPLLIRIGAALLFLTACGGDDGGDSEPKPAVPKKKAKLISDVKSEIVAGKHNYSPASFLEVTVTLDKKAKLFVKLGEHTYWDKAPIEKYHGRPVKVENGVAKLKVRIVSDGETELRLFATKLQSGPNDELDELEDERVVKTTVIDRKQRVWMGDENNKSGVPCPWTLRRGKLVLDSAEDRSNERHRLYPVEEDSVRLDIKIPGATAARWNGSALPVDSSGTFVVRQKVVYDDRDAPIRGVSKLAPLIAIEVEQAGQKLELKIQCPMQGLSLGKMWRKGGFVFPGESKTDKKPMTILHGRTTIIGPGTKRQDITHLLESKITSVDYKPCKYLNTRTNGFETLPRGGFGQLITVRDRRTGKVVAKQRWRPRGPKPCPKKLREGETTDYSDTKSRDPVAWAKKRFKLK